MIIQNEGKAGKVENEDKAEAKAGNGCEWRELLEGLRQSLSLAEFENDVLGDARKLERQLEKVKAEGEGHYKEALGVLLEIHNYHDEIPRLRQMLSEECKAALGQLAETAKAKKFDPALVEPMIWLAIHHAQSLYKEEHYGESQTVLLRCLANTEELVSSTRESEPVAWNSISARMQFMLGQTYRHLYEFDNCEKAYVDAIQYSLARLERKRKSAGQADSQHGESGGKTQDRFFPSREIGLCCLGLALSYLAQGRIRSARAFAISARALLMPSGDWLNKAYVDLVSGGLQRAEAGFDRDKLEGAIKTLHSPLRVFLQRRMERYALKAQFQLALAYSQAGRIEEAEESIDFVLTTAGKLGNARWKCKGMMVKSRILLLRKDPQGAEEQASRALEIGQTQRLATEHLAQARIARAAARIDLERFEEARQDLRQAQRACEHHPQTQAVVHVHFARAYVRERNLRLALKHFGEYRKLEPGIENVVVRDLAKRVNKEIESRREDFLISRGEQVLTYDEHVKKLREFLVRQAKQKYGTHDQIAKALGVTRQTLYNWLAAE